MGMGAPGREQPLKNSLATPKGMFRKMMCFYFLGVSGTCQMSAPAPACCSSLFTPFGPAAGFSVPSGFCCCCVDGAVGANARFGLTPNGIADVLVKTGRSPRFIGEGVVVVLGGSQRSGSCWRTASGVGPSGWYGMKTSGALVGAISVPMEGLEGNDGCPNTGPGTAGELEGSGTLLASWTRRWGVEGGSVEL